ncbi:MAG: NAD(P)H-hydrate dehydratase [bacterium]
MRVVTNAEMKKIDSWAIKKFGISGPVLMENAGRGCVDVLETYFELDALRVLIVCGKGNNGGDGFVVARHLQNRGAEVKIALLGNIKELKGDALLNCRLAKTGESDIIEISRSVNLNKLCQSFNPDVIVDAIFGTGFAGTPQGLYYQTIELINRTDTFVLSIDIPSGINGDDGQFKKTCVIADTTATMCLPKRGNYLYPGRAFSGDLYTIDIGIPYPSIDRGFPRVTEDDDVAPLLPYRPPDGNKGTFGQVLMVAGARGFSGAAAMAAQSALRMGAGLVRLAAPQGIIDALESKLMEVVKVPLEQTSEVTISPAAIGTVIPLLKTSQTFVIGPGITTNPETAKFLHAILPRITKPLIIDADAINIIAQDLSILGKIKAPFIMTPHPGELARLIKLTPKQINERRIDLATGYAREFNCVMVLKGAPTVIAAPGGETYINPTGNSGLASAGSGDVLVGMISGLLAQKIPLLDAAIAGVFLHGLCADLALEENNEYSLMAGDLVRYIQNALNFILRRQHAE